MAITTEQFNAACHHRDENDWPMDANGQRLGPAYLAADPEFDWNSGIVWIPNADVIRRSGMHDGCCTGPYG